MDTVFGIQYEGGGVLTASDVKLCDERSDRVVIESTGVTTCTRDDGAGITCLFM
jgi:hypothetical protein